MTQELDLDPRPLVFLSQAGNRRRDVSNTLSAVRSHIAKRSQVQRRRRIKESSIFVLNHASLPPKMSQSMDEVFQQIREQSCSPFTINLPADSPSSFQTSTIPVTAAIRHLLSFHQAHITLAVGAGLLKPSKVPEFRAKFLRDSRNILDNSLTATAFVARYAALIANVTKRDDTAMMALEYKNYVSEQLRSTMTTGLNGTGNSLNHLSKTCWAIYSLMASELYAGNTSGAAFHGEMLFHLLQSNMTSLGVTAHRLVYAALWQDTQRAQITLTLPTLEPDSLAMIFPSVNWERRSSRGDALNIDEEISNSILKASIEELRYHFAKCDDGETLSDFASDFELGQPSDRLLLIGARLTMAFGHLSNELLDQANVYLLAERRGALAAVYWHRRACKLEDLGVTSQVKRPDTFTFTAASLILERMKTFFELPHSTQASQFRPRLTLWTLYVAAWAEQTLHGWKTVPVRGEAYFNIAFVKHAAAIGVHTWAAAQDILESFLYFPSMTPFASAWFEVFRRMEIHGQELEPGNNLVVQLESAGKRGSSPTPPPQQMIERGTAQACFYEPCLGAVTWFLQPPWTHQIDPTLE